MYRGQQGVCIHTLLVQCSPSPSITKRLPRLSPRTNKAHQPPTLPPVVPTHPRATAATSQCNGLQSRLPPPCFPSGELLHRLCRGLLSPLLCRHGAPPHSEASAAERRQRGRGHDAGRPSEPSENAYVSTVPPRRTEHSAGANGPPAATSSSSTGRRVICVTGAGSP